MSYGYVYRGYAAYGQTVNVSRPVLVDADGPKVPILLSIPNQEGHTYVAKAETVVEHVRVPLTEFLLEPPQDYGRRHSSPPKARPVEHYGYKPEPVKDYGYKPEPVKDYGYKPEPVKSYGYKAEPVKDYGYKPEPVREYPVKDYGYKAEPLKDYGHKAEPVKDYGHKAEPVKDYGHKAEPVKDYGYKADPVRDYGYKAEPVNGYGYRAEPEREYGYKAAPEKEYAKKAEPGQYERRSEPTTVHNYGSDRLRDPSSPTRDRPPEVEEFIAKVQTDAGRPNRIPPLTAPKWRQSPNSNGNTAPPARYTVPPSTQPIRNVYGETIDSREAARRYGSSNPSRPGTTGRTYTTTINNRDAARKYGGTTI